MFRHARRLAAGQFRVSPVALRAVCDRQRAELANSQSAHGRSVPPVLLNVLCELCVDSYVFASIFPFEYNRRRGHDMRFMLGVFNELMVSLGNENLMRELVRKFAEQCAIRLTELFGIS